MSAGNPFWDLHSCLWALLEDEAVATDLIASGLHFTDLVPDRTRNRIKFTRSDKNPIKELSSRADTPAVTVWGLRIKAQGRPASNSDFMQLQWEILVRTAEQPFGVFYDLQWAIIRQLLAWDARVKAITWGSENPFKIMKTLGCEDSLLDERRNKNLRGWTAAWVGTTDCWLSHVNLIA